MSKTIPITFKVKNDNVHQDFGNDAEINVEAFGEDFSVVPPDESATALLWAVLCSYLPNDEKSIQRLFVYRAEYDLALTFKQMQENPRQQFLALALSVRDRLIERWKDTELYFDRQQAKKVYYMSLEFLMGRSLLNAVSNLNLTQSFSRALRNLGIQMEELYEEETDAGLGNGGLGRLASCYLDSLATANFPAWGYGLRYTYGIFHQLIKNGYQVEIPDFWLRYGNPWEIKRNDIQYPIEFYGYVSEIPDPEAEGGVHYKWEGKETVMAVAYDVPIPGFRTFNTINLRLWSSAPSREFDFDLFNRGDYFAAIENKQRSETITSVLYPNDNTAGGKELRLKQQYFFVSASLHDILKRFKETKKPIEELPDMVSIQLNDTHPSLGIAELMRILVDSEKTKWDHAWAITRKVFAYTNHTVLPEALEKWDVGLMQHLLPRHMQIIYKINHFFLLQVEKAFPAENVIEMKRKLSLIQEEPDRKVRMAHLAIVGSHHINGVAKIHSELLKTHVFPEFYKLFPEMFTNVTNGVTPRRWLQQSNPSLTKLISDTLGHERWLCSLSDLAELKKHATIPAFQEKWRESKQTNKKRLAKWVHDKLNLTINSSALFDVQIKRIHEYKRQLLNILFVIWRYRQIKGMSDDERADVVPRVIMFGGKAAPGYWIAKLVIKLINSVATKVNEDADMEDLLKVIYLPNYNVSLAEIVIPASDLSQHISTAGMEASGTSNMKFAMNGGLLIGTLDGANIEIREEIGEENMFIFGTRAEDVEDARTQVRNRSVTIDRTLEQVLQMLENGLFGEFPELPTLLNSFLNGHDYYLLTVDWASYLQAQELVDKTFKDQQKWTQMSILSTAGMGFFSSDRCVEDYAKEIWNLKPAARPGPVSVDTSILISKVGADKLGSLTPMSPLDFASPLTGDIALERLAPKDADMMQSCSPSSSPFRWDKTS